MNTNLSPDSWEHSLLFIHKATPSTQLIDQIQDTLHAREKLSSFSVMLIAASMIVLVSVNLFVLQNKPIKNESANAIYGAIIQSNQLYY